MNFIGRKFTGFRRRVASLVDPSATQLRRALKSVYYEQSATCEIPNLWFLLAKFLGERSSGFFVEIGAFDGVTASNTWGLARKGWSGILVEPIDTHARQCQLNHRAHLGVIVVQQAIAPAGFDSLRLELARTLTTANTALADAYRDIDWAQRNMTGVMVEVPCTSLDEFLTHHEVEPSFDLLSVDVEGFETEVFSGFDLARWRPRMIIVELVDTHPDLSVAGRADAILAQEITQTGYVVVYKDKVNSVFVRREDWRRAFDLNQSVDHEC